MVKDRSAYWKVQVIPGNNIAGDYFYMVTWGTVTLRVDPVYSFEQDKILAYSVCHEGTGDVDQWQFDSSGDAVMFALNKIKRVRDILSPYDNVPF